MLLFTPAHCAPGREPLDVLVELLPHVDLVQVRIKSEHAAESPDAPSPAAELFAWTARVLEVAPAAVPVLVNDRVDVALALEPAGCAGVHLGQGDMPAAAAREVLGAAPLLGLSTHSTRQVVAAQLAPVDYLGFGPIFATATKGYAEGHGPEAAWIAASGSELPLFPIGGIDVVNATELAPVGRAAVTAALLGAADPARAAVALRAAVES